MNWLDNLSMGKPLKKSRVDPLPIGNMISDEEMLNNFAHEVPSEQKSLSPSQVKRFRKDLMRRGYNAKQATKHANKALKLSEKYMNEPNFPGQSRLYGKFDFDGDGVPNSIDCFPFDKKRQGLYYAGRSSSGGKNYRISGVTYSKPATGGSYSGQYSDKGGSSSGGSGGGGSSYSAPKPKSTGALPVISNPYKPGTANYAKAEAYKKAYAAGDVKGGVIQNPIKYLGSSSGGFTGFSNAASGKSVYTPDTKKYNNTISILGNNSLLSNFSKDNPEISVIQDNLQSTRDKPEILYHDEEGRAVIAEYDVPNTIKERYTIGYEPVYGTYLDQAEYEAKRAELIEKIYGGVLDEQQSRFDKRSETIDKALKKKYKKKASLGGPSVISRQKYSLGEYNKLKDAAIVNTNLSNLRGALYGEQEAKGPYKKIVEKSKDDMAELKKAATKTYVTGEQGAPIRGERERTITTRKKVFLNN
jgi:hypothetical protein